MILTKLNEYMNKGRVLFPMYHGSRRIFDKFSQHGNDGHILSFLGFHFTPDKKTAEKFARKPEKIVYVVELTVSKTLRITESDLIRNILKWGLENGYVEQSAYNLVINRPYFSASQSSIMDAFDAPFYSKGLGLRNGGFKEFGTKYKEYLISKGFDSIEYLNEIEFDTTPNRWDYIVFSPDQIKIVEKYSTLEPYKLPYPQYQKKQ